jgi:hypothetical protein
VPAAFASGQTVLAESEFGELNVLFEPSEPPTVTAVFSSSELGQEQTISFSVDQRELLRAAAEMPAFLGESDAA